MCTFKIRVCTDDTEPFLKHCVANLVFLLVFILVENEFLQTGVLLVRCTTK